MRSILPGETAREGRRNVNEGNLEFKTHRHFCRVRRRLLTSSYPVVSDSLPSLPKISQLNPFAEKQTPAARPSGLSTAAQRQRTPKHSCCYRADRSAASGSERRLVAARRRRQQRSRTSARQCEPQQVVERGCRYWFEQVWPCDGNPVGVRRAGFSRSMPPVRSALFLLLADRPFGGPQWCLTVSAMPVPASSRR